MGTTATSDATFSSDVLTSELPVLVDFWAEWCVPCRQVAPVLEEIANEYSEHLKVVKLNVDQNPQVSAQYGITSIPTMAVFAKGQVVKSIVGALPKQAIVQQLGDYLH